MPSAVAAVSNSCRVFAHAKLPSANSTLMRYRRPITNAACPVAVPKERKTMGMRTPSTQSAASAFAFAAPGGRLLRTR